MSLYYKRCGLFNLSHQVISDLELKTEIGVGLCCKPNHNGLILFNPREKPPESLIDLDTLFTTKIITRSYSPCIYIKRLSEINTVSDDAFVVSNESEYCMCNSMYYPISTDENKRPNKYIGMVQISKSGKKRFAISSPLADLLELTDNKMYVAFSVLDQDIIVGQKFDEGSVYETKNAKNVQYVRNKSIVRQIEDEFELDDITKQLVFKCEYIDWESHMAVLKIPYMKGIYRNA